MKASPSTLKPIRKRDWFFYIVMSLVLAGMITDSINSWFGRHVDPAWNTRASADLLTLERHIETFRESNGRMPSNLDNLRVYFLRSSRSGDFMDPWGRKYIYVCPGRHNVNGYDLFTRGRDGQPGTLDDIENWEEADSAAPASK